MIFYTVSVFSPSLLLSESGRSLLGHFAAMLADRGRLLDWGLLWILCCGAATRSASLVCDQKQRWDVNGPWWRHVLFGPLKPWFQCSSHIYPHGVSIFIHKCAMWQLFTIVYCCFGLFLIYSRFGLFWSISFSPDLFSSVIYVFPRSVFGLFLSIILLSWTYLQLVVYPVPVRFFFTHIHT